MNSVTVFLIVCLCASAFSKYLPEKYVAVGAVDSGFDSDLRPQSLKRHHENPHTGVILRKLRGFVGDYSCPEGQIRLPFAPPMNKCVSQEKYDSFMNDDDDDDENINST